jgi:hypothetical protein
VPHDVDQLVITALERNPAKRWQSAAAMRTALADYASRRLTHQQLVAWVEWAFSQQRPVLREDSAVSALYEILDSKQVQVVSEPPAMSAAMEERRRESVAMTPVFGAALVQRRTSRRWPWIALSLLVAAGAGLLLARKLGVL